MPKGSFQGLPKIGIFGMYKKHHLATLIGMCIQRRLFTVIISPPYYCLLHFLLRGLRFFKETHFLSYSVQRYLLTFWEMALGNFISLGYCVTFLTILPLLDSISRPINSATYHTTTSPHDHTTKDQFYQIPFRPKFFRINFNPQILDKLAYRTEKQNFIMGIMDNCLVF
jgi:hypothetical protein